MAKSIGYKLVVIHAFGKYRRGDEITDPGIIADILVSENVHSVRKVAA
ncbi:MAG: hypothetical protein ACYC0Z_13110 [Acidobacteriaceae bacterium]